MPQRQPFDRRVHFALMAGVAVWALMVAGSIAWHTGKWLAVPVTVGCVGAFLGLWALSLRKGNGGPHDRDDADTDDRGEPKA